MPQPRVTTRLQLDDGKGEPIAHVTIDHRDAALWLTDVWTHPNHRRQGYARQLIRTALELHPCQVWYLQVYPYTDQPIDAPALETFYRGFGFGYTDVPGVMVRRFGPGVMVRRFGPMPTPRPAYSPRY